MQTRPQFEANTHCKNTWVISTMHIFGYLSCIIVTLECYKIGFLKS